MALQLTTTQAITEKLAQIEALAQGGELLEGVGRAIRTRIEISFRNSTDPYGEKWKPLKFRAGQPLSNTGRLRNSMTYKSENDRVEFGTNVCYAVVHQFGATIEATPGQTGGSGLCGYQRKGRATLAFQTPGGWIRAKRVEIPARPFFPDQRGMPKAWALAIRREINERFKQL